MKNLSSPIWKLSDKKFVELIRSCKTYTEILAGFGLKNRGNNHKTLKKRMTSLGIVFKSLGYNRSSIDQKRKPVKYYLIKNTKTQITNSCLKRKLIKEGILKDVCAVCDIPNIWNGKYLSMHVDHKNGDPNDNRLKNIQLICPNCHSQTSNYCGKAKKILRKSCIVCHKRLGRHNSTGLCKMCFGRKMDHPDKITWPSKMNFKKMIKHIPYTKIGEKLEKNWVLQEVP